MRFSFKDLVGRMFSKSSETNVHEALPIGSQPTAKPTKVQARPSLYLQIGFDFGSAFTKVVIRDVRGETAKVFLPEVASTNDAFPFLIPSIVYFDNADDGNSWLSTKRWNASNTELHYPKLALCAVSGAHHTANDILEPYTRAAARAGLPVADFVEAVATFYMASVLSQVTRSLRNGDLKFGAHTDDEMAVCMALPAENLSNHAMSTRFLGCLRRAYTYLMDPESPDLTSSATVADIYRNWSRLSDDLADVWQCELYPEVSANMVAYTQSRASSEGLFKMVDVGAGTVDASFFSFVRNNDGPKLSNFSGQVSFCGSSRIEREACVLLKYPFERLQELRQKKEGHSNPIPHERTKLDEARRMVGEEVATLAHRSIVDMLPRLPNHRQMEETRFLFVGGGASRYPYQDATLEKWEHIGRRHRGLVSIPVPPDLSSPGNRDDWFRRLTVAYGLSFDPANRPATTLPGDHNEAPQVTRESRIVRSAPSKDEC